jgi:hypothetical protein
VFITPHYSLTLAAIFQCALFITSQAPYCCFRKLYLRTKTPPVWKKWSLLAGGTISLSGAFTVSSRKITPVVLDGTDRSQLVAAREDVFAS